MAACKSRFLRLLDERIHHVGLPLVVQFIPENLISAAPLRLAEKKRPHRLSPGRQRVDHRDIQIPIDGHRQRPRNRGRGQHRPHPAYSLSQSAFFVAARRTYVAHPRPPVPNFLNVTPFWIKACVPIATWMRPEANCCDLVFLRRRFVTASEQRRLEHQDCAKEPLRFR